MGELFHVADGGLQVLRPVPFQEGHTEEDLQRWADANPHFLNNGLPMLSLGTEIVTHHGYSIDNLFIDGNGCLVVAELKRGLTPKDVIAQVVNYATYASRLRWPNVEAFCREKHGIDLDTAYKRCFGWPLPRADKIEHRLLILAESYDPRVTDAALYLINNGTPLALLQFTYFEIVDCKLFEVRTVLGEIPEQRGAPADTATPDQGRINWLLSSVAEQLPEIARRHAWSLRHFVRKQSLPFVSEHWPTTLDQCQLVLATWSRDKLSFRLKFRHGEVPGLRELLEGRRDRWCGDFPAEFAAPPYETLYTNLGYDVPMMDVGDTKMLADAVERTEKMAGAMVPLLEEFFAGRDTSDT